MKNIKIFYLDSWGSVKFSSEYPTFPASNTSERRLSAPWKSAYGDETAGGTFEITSTNGTFYFDEGFGTVSFAVIAGIYNATTLAAAIDGGLNTYGIHDYTVNYRADLLKFEIFDNSSGQGGVILRGTETIDAIWGVIGFYNADTAQLYYHVADEIRIHTHEYVWSAIAYGVSGIFALGHNITTNGIIKAQLTDDNTFVSIQAEYDMLGVGGTGGVILDTPNVYQYCRIWVSDPTNPDGYIKIGRVYASPGYTPTYGYVPKPRRRYNDRSLLNESIAGAVSPVRRNRQRERMYSFDLADQGMFDFYDTVGITEPFVMLEQDIEKQGYADVSDALYARLKSFSSRYVAAQTNSATLSVIEEL